MYINSPRSYRGTIFNISKNLSQAHANCLFCSKFSSLLTPLMVSRTSVDFSFWEVCFSWNVSLIIFINIFQSFPFLFWNVFMYNIPLICSHFFLGVSVLLLFPIMFFILFIYFGIIVLTISFYKKEQMFMQRYLQSEFHAKWFLLLLEFYI